MAYSVKIEKDALAAMLMNGLEAFTLSMRNKEKKKNSGKEKGHEVFAHIFGKLKKKKEDDYEYTVEFVNFDITALSNQDWVAPNHDALELKREIAKIMFPKRKLLGTFHTHPYRLDENLTDRFGNYMWTPSRGDKNCHGEDFQLDLIMAVMNAQKALTKGTCKIDNCVQFNLENIRFCLAAYVRRYDEEMDCSCYVDSAEVFLNRKGGMWRVPKYVDSAYVKVLLKNKDLP